MLINYEDDKKMIYKCPFCGIEYNDMKWAEKCELFCRNQRNISRKSVMNNIMQKLERKC